MHPRLIIAYFITLLLLMVIQVDGLSQNIDPELVRKELAKTGFTEDEVRAKLVERGIDIDNISPAELPELESTMNEILAELEQEKAAADKDLAKDIANEVEKQADAEVQKGLQELSGEAAEDVQEAVAEGKPIDEAITEEILEEKNKRMPPAEIYGHHIFRNKSIKVFNQATGVRAPDTYELGPKDVLNISFWGYSQQSNSYEISQDGYIKPEKMQRIFLKGITLGKAKKLLMQAFSKYYSFKPDEFAVNLNYSRTITVNITGEAINPGSYTLPAINTAINALVASGGPSDIGSVRNIKLFRPGSSPKNIDVYDYISNPNMAQNTYLQDGDFLFIPVNKKVVSITGAINRPFRYELKDNEQLTSLIDYAGGFLPNVYKSNIQIKRFENDTEKLIDVAYQQLLTRNQDFSLNNGDQVRVFSIPRRYENFVEISGEVSLPGEYEIEENWTITNLLNQGKLLPSSRMDVAYLQRANDDGTYQLNRINLEDALANPTGENNQILRPKDKLIIFAKSRFVDNQVVSINGSVRNPTEIAYDVSQNMRVEDLIELAGGLKPDATDFGFLYRKELGNTKEIEYIVLNIKEVIENAASEFNMVIEPQDQLVIPSKNNYLEDAKVLISGAVRNPGDYNYDVSLTFDKLLLMAGGLRMQAARNRVDVFRVLFDQNNPTKTEQFTIELDENGQLMESFVLMPYDQIRVRNIPDFEFQQNVQILGEVKYPGTYALTEDNEKILTTINKAGGLTIEAFPQGATIYRQKDNIGYIVLQLEDVLKSNKSRFNLVLQGGDIIDIPKVKDFVSIAGATKARELYKEKTLGTNNRINVPYHEGRRANFYVDEYAAGTSERGRKRLITVSYPNGQIKETKNFLIFNSYPKVTQGAEIMVGAISEKEAKKKEEKDKEPVDWGKLLGDTIAQATTIITLLLLVQRIN